MKLASSARVACCVAALCVACDSEEQRGDPQPPPKLPQAASLIPVAPAPQPTTTPPPAPAPGELLPPAIPGGGGGGSGGTGGAATTGDCGSPAPPPLSRLSVHVLGGNGERTLLDATPLVGPDADFCRAIGFTDGRLFCAVRPEGSPERSTCEAALVGTAADTGRPGPTWSADGRPCDAGGEPTRCVNHPSNQYLVYAFGSGTFRACAAGGACGEVRLP